MFLRLLTAVAALAATATATLKDCGEGRTVFTITDMSMEPTDPAPGDTVALTLAYDVPPGVSVTDGTSTYAITYNFIPFDPEVKPLCSDVPCPLGPGAYKNTTYSSWPTGISGYLTSTMSWADAAGKPLLCLEVDSMIQNRMLPAPPPVPAPLQPRPNRTVSRLRGAEVLENLL